MIFAISYVHDIANCPLSVKKFVINRMILYFVVVSRTIVAKTTKTNKDMKLVQPKYL